jgi:hypothetical protein
VQRIKDKELNRYLKEFYVGIGLRNLDPGKVNFRGMNVQVTISGVQHLELTTSYPNALEQYEMTTTVTGFTPN